jgi:predicted RND superfamily exporter protein
MLTLVNILILFFTILVIYQIFLASFGDSIIEGLTSDNTNNTEYKPYNTNDSNNALILAQQNAGNISVLKKQMDDLSGLNNQVQDLSGNVTTLQGQVDNLITSQNAYASSTLPSTPPDISGTTSDTTDTTTSDTTTTN